MLPTRLQLLILLSFAAKYFEAHPDFSIDYANRTFLFDDQPYRYISGEVHYFRIRPEQWKDRLSKIRAAGLNAIQTYIPWNFHENFEREYNFVGDRDIIHFLDLAAAQNLSVLLRIGPYICAEWENGGLPWWLLKYPNITMRSSDPNFVKEVQRWWNILLPKFVPYLRRNGGPIIMIQLENEYGSYRCDRSYLQQLRDLSRSLLGNDTIFFTTDASTLLSCGHIDGTFATVDFGSLKSITMAESVFRQQNLYNNNGGPNVNSEYYPGWFSTWGGPEPKHSNTEEIARMFHMMLSMNASFNYYMFHGGTNFGFWNGAEIYAAVTTSYDYFAPLTESGDITDVYTTIHDLIANITDWSNRPAEQLPPPSRKIAYGEIEMRRIGSIFSLNDDASKTTGCFISTRPLTFEQINFPYGYVIYSTTIRRGSVLDGSNIRDFGYIFIDDIYQGVISPNYMPNPRSKLPLKFVENSSKIKIIVENRGRQTYPTINDSKGIIGDIFVDGIALSNWTICGVDLEMLQNSWHHLNDKNKSTFQPGDIFVGEFTAKQIADTYLEPFGWGKGVAFINNFNIGKYWPTAGPQVTLYVPEPLLNTTNVVMLIELESIPIKCATNLQKCRVRFVDKPVYKTGNERISSLLQQKV